MSNIGITYILDVDIATPLEGFAFANAIQTHSEYNTDFMCVELDRQDQLSYLGGCREYGKGIAYIKDCELKAQVHGYAICDADEVEALKADMELMREAYAEYITKATGCNVNVGEVKVFENCRDWDIDHSQSFDTFFSRE